MGWRFGVLALAVGVVCAVGIAISGSIRDDALRRDLAAQVTATADANALAEVAKAEAVNAHLELAKFKAPRGMSFEGVEKFKARLSPFAGTRVDMVAFGETQEIWGATSIIFKGLAMAHWRVSPVQTAIGGGVWAAIPGVKVLVLQNCASEIKTAAHELIGALNDAGIPTVSWGDFAPRSLIPAAAIAGAPPIKNGSQIRIYVGPKNQE